jgi:hypothetical protein
MASKSASGLSKPMIGKIDGGFWALHRLDIRFVEARGAKKGRPKAAL